MTKLATIAASVVLLTAASADAAPALRCFTGPVNRTFGGTNWLVYSCDDARSMVVVSAVENPAAPFVFYLTPDGDRYRVIGEGNGSKEASDKAGDALSSMSDADFAALLRATVTHPAQRPSE